VIPLLSLALLAHLVSGQVGAPAAPRQADDGFQCGNRLITLGDLKSEVLFVCGSPLLRDQHREVRGEGNARVTVLIDVWTYDAGPHRFLRTLTFENGRLVEILAARMAR
jgi:hypothetical protein